jgi:ATP:corrinoid adenosyltransferase
MTWFFATRFGKAVSALGVGIALLVAAWLAGRREGNKNANSDIVEANLEAAKTAKEIRHEIETSDDQHLVDVLTGKLHNDNR